MRSRRLVPVFGLVLGVLAASAGAQQTTLHSPKNPNALQGPQATKRQPAVPAFGTATRVYQRIPASAFIADTIDTGSNNTPYSSTWLPPGGLQYLRGAESPTGFNHFIASPILPGGALLTFIELDNCDSNSGSNHVLLDVYDCDYLANCNTPPLLSLSSVNNIAPPPGCSYTNNGFLSYTVDNYNRQILLDVTLQSGDVTNLLAGVIIGYTLQVSPAPGSPTFNDVPTSDPAFQFIEAFNAAGITAGCSVSPPLYCPDANVTRRQMAVFFAKALGLNWSQ